MKKYIEPLMKALTDRMPRKVAFAAVTMAITLVTFGVLFFSLGGAHTNAMAQNQSLKGSLDQTSRSAKQARDDRQFVLDNQVKYEELLRGDRLVPHTQNVAKDQLRTLALQRGIFPLMVTFSAASPQSATAAASQPGSGGYDVKIEKMELKLGAPLDVQVFEFMLDLAESFPGSAVLEKFSLERAPDISTEALNQVSRGGDSRLVIGEAHLTWRTAQAKEQK